jgi:carbohydrate diacid regulator
LFSKLFQTLINQIKDTIEIELGVMDESGLILASSNEEKVGSENQNISDVLKIKDQIVILAGCTYQKVYNKSKLDFIAFICSSEKENLKYLTLFSINLSNLKMYYGDRFDKRNFLKEIIIGNVLHGDIILKAKELHLDFNVSRVVLLIKTDKIKDTHVYDIIQGMFPNKTKDFVIVLDEDSVVLIKEIKTNDDNKEIEKTAKIIIDALNAELMIKVFIGVGTVVNNIRDIETSYNEAKVALQIGRVFEDNKSIIYYNNLGIGRLIYQIPKELCEMFLKELFKEHSNELLDPETMNTIMKFFENNLNVSETSRQLYVHRNTLVYRLDKIQKLTGLDLRNFDDAIIFKVATWVRKYLANYMAG